MTLAFKIVFGFLLLAFLCSCLTMLLLMTTVGKKKRDDSDLAEQAEWLEEYAKEHPDWAERARAKQAKRLERERKKGRATA